MLRDALLKQGGRVRLDGLTFGYPQLGERHAAVVPDPVVPFTTDFPGRQTVLYLQQTAQQPPVLRVLDRVGLPEDLIPAGVQHVVVSADPEQARAELAGVSPEDALFVPADLTDRPLRELLPSGVRPYLIRLGPGVANGMRTRGPQAIRDLIALAGLEENHQLTVWDVNQVTFDHYAITVITVDRAA